MKKRGNNLKSRFSNFGNSFKSKLMQKKDKKIKPNNSFNTSNFDVFVNMANVATRAEEHNIDHRVRKIITHTMRKI